VYRAVADVVRGDPANPLSRDELVQKCRQCLEGVLPPDRADRVVTTVGAMEHLPDIIRLREVLQAG
jgi:hypothetical protein